jgi:hypothetical protein
MNTKVYWMLTTALADYSCSFKADLHNLNSSVDFLKELGIKGILKKTKNDPKISELLNQYVSSM